MRGLAIAALAIGLASSPARGQDRDAAPSDDDLQRIPKAAMADTAPQPQARALRANLDSVASIAEGRTAIDADRSKTALVRTSLDAVYDVPVIVSIGAYASARLNLVATDATPSGDTDLLGGADWREAYAKVAFGRQLFVDVGRININHGVALGYNPTDVFKTGSAVSQASSDPSALRSDRLGVVAVRVQALWSGGALSFAYAPRLASPSAVPFTIHRGFGWLVGRTNSADRVLVTAARTIVNLSVEASAYEEHGGFRGGLNLSHPVGNSIVVYAEASGGREHGIVDRAIAFGQRTGTLPSGQIAIPGLSGHDGLTTDLAVGASWSGARRLTINLEYHHHPSGLSRGAVREFRVAADAAPATVGQLFGYVQAYADFQQEPLQRQQLFARVSCVDALTRDLTLSGFVLTDGHGGLGQFSASYPASNHWTFSVFARQTWQGSGSAWGSLGTRSSVALEVRRYF